MNDSTNSPASPRRRRKSRLPMILGVTLVVAAAATWYGVHVYRAKAAAEGEYLFAPIETGDIEDLVSSTGTLQPRDYVDVGAQVSGQIETIYVEVGDAVQEGQKLVEIDATTAKARVEQNQAQMEQSKTNLVTAQANLEKSKRDFERQENLLKEDATTRESWLNAKTVYENAVRSVETSKLGIAANEASQRIEANNLKYTTIVAPISGTVMSIAVKKGQTINASQQAPNVMRIANLSTMTVASDVSEADIARLYDKIPVYFTTLSGGNNRWTSILKRIEPTPKTQNGVVLYNALFDVENEGSLRPSMTAQVYYVAAEARNVLKVPMAAIQQGQQISRELAAKARAEGKQPAAGAPGAPGAAPGTPGAGAATSAAGAREGGSAPATAAAGGTNPAAPAAQGTGAQNNRQANAQGGQRPNGQGGNFGGQRPGGGQGGNFGGQRPGGGQGGFGGQRPGGGFGGGNFTPEQIAEFQRMRGSGNFGGGFNRQGAMGSAGSAGAAPRQAQRRRGIVMVKKADGTLEQRSIMYGVSDRVFGEVLEGLKEGEQVVVGKREPEAAASRPLNQNNNQNFQNNQNFRGGNNFQGGGNFGGGGGRPF